MFYKKTHIIQFNKIGEGSIGYISVVQAEQEIPFKIKRIFWTYYTPESITRGRHAHYYTEQVLIAVAGKINVMTELPDGKSEIFILDTPDKGLYIPPNVWHTMQYSHSSVQLVFASTKYDESDYIRKYEDFKKHYSGK